MTEDEKSHLQRMNRRLIKRDLAIVLLECGHWLQISTSAAVDTSLRTTPNITYYCKFHNSYARVARDEIDDTAAILTSWDCT